MTKGKLVFVVLFCVSTHHHLRMTPTHPSPAAPAGTTRRSTLERNPDAFTRALVLVKDPDSVLDGAGCGCTKSQCLKK